MDSVVSNPIAVIGFSLKFPGDANSSEAFWRMLEEKRCAMTEWPVDRVNLEAFIHRDSKDYVLGAHFMKEDPALFDAPFFGISGTEAAAMDPQHRILLETAYRALESAGIPIEKASGTKTGVYTGCMTDDYKRITSHDLDLTPKYAVLGTTMSMLANRLSWFLNLHGPSVSLDSACSSSLMALDMACQGLRNKDSDMALVAGSALILGAEAILSLTRMNVLSPHGRSYSFDSRANGYGRGEGCGVVVLKRLSDAIADGDSIRAVIRSTGSNQDGYTPGVTQPSKELQARLILDTYRKAGLSLSETRFFEAHGTGTAIGDPTEAEAIGSVFRMIRSADDPLYIGAVKSNIGHLEGGSGIAGIIKTIMVLEKGIIPPNANFECLNPEIDAEFLNIKIPTENTPWPTKGLRRASVSSFGYGGSNAHAVLEDAFHYLESHNLTATHFSVTDPPSDRKLTNHSEQHPVDVPGNHNTKRPVRRLLKPLLFVWSSKDEGGVQRTVDAYNHFFRGITDKDIDEARFLGQLATILAVKRSKLSWRVFALADSLGTLKTLESVTSKPIQTSKLLGLGYIFTGQGAQYYHMGMDLIQYPVFRQTMELCDEALHSFGCGWSTLDLLAHPDVSYDISDPEISQPLTTALQISLVELLSFFGLKPSTVVGHSSGEIAAAYAAGALSLPSACQVSYFRGVHAGSLKKRGTGAMLAVSLSENEVEPYLELARSKHGNLSLFVSCINSPSNITISGDSEMVGYLKATLDKENITSRPLRTGIAYHTPQMREISADYALSLQGLTRSPQVTRSVTMISSVSGKMIENLESLSTPNYWVKNLLNPVRFCNAMIEALSSTTIDQTRRKHGSSKEPTVSDWLEVGPHSTLQRPFREILQATPNKGDVRYASVLDRRLPPFQSLLSLAGRLYSQGFEISLNKINQIQEGMPISEKALVNLPEYQFNHSRRYWHESSTGRNVRLRPHKRHELLGTPTPESTPSEAIWRKIFDSSETPWILDHSVNGKPIYPASGMIVMAVEGATQLVNQTRNISGFLVQDAVFMHPISISQIATTEANLYMRSLHQVVDKSSQSYEFRIYTELGHQWQETCRGIISVQSENQVGETDQNILNLLRASESEHYQSQLEDAVRQCREKVSSTTMYKAFEANGLNYGPAFQVLDDIAWNDNGCAVGTIKVFPWTRKQSRNGQQRHVIHPATVDGLGQLGWAALTKGGRVVLSNGLVSTRVRQAWISASGASSFQTSRLKAYTQSEIVGLRGANISVVALDDAGRPKLRISSIEMTSVSGSWETSTASLQRKQLCYSIEWKPDIQLLSKEQLQIQFGPQQRDEDHYEFWDYLEILLLYFARKVVQKADALGTSHLSFHLQKYVSWLKWQLDRYNSGHVLPILGHHPLLQDDDPELVQRLCQKVMEMSPEGNLFVTVGNKIEGILEGTVEPLELLFSDGLAANHYCLACNRLLERGHFSSYLEALGHRSPSMRILEIGAGTGSMTNHILQALSSNSTGKGHMSKFLRYDYTDISEAFFEDARQRYASYGQKFNFRILDIENDPGKQGFELGSYDLVVAGWVLHATKNLSVSIHNVRKLLKPGGKLVLVELTQPETLRNGFIFGTLPGWWLSTEEYRQWGPSISEEKWTEILKLNHFNDLDLVYADNETERYREHSLMVATAACTTTGLSMQGNTRRRIVFVVDANRQLQANLVQYLTHALSSEQIECETLSFREIAALSVADNPLVVFLPEIETSVLADLSNDLFQALHTFLCTVQDVVWVTASSKRTPASAKMHLIRGLAKVLCTENDRLSFVTASLEHRGDNLARWEKHIHSIISSRLLEGREATELDYQEQDGVLCIGRVAEAEDMNDLLFEQTQAPLKMRQFRQNIPLSVRISNPGSLDANSMIFVEDLEYGKGHLSPYEIEIEVKSVGVNFRDVLILLGKLRDGATLGHDCAGIVTRVGSHCQSLRPGDPVCAAIGGCLRTFARCDYRQACKLPNDMTFTVAASIPTPGATAYHCLVKIAHLQKGESVLIHAGAGGTGQMAIQIAQNLGAEIFVTVGSQEKRNLLSERYNIPQDHILYSRDTSFTRRLMQLTGDRGVDVVLNSLSGDSLIASWECIAPFGRFVEIGRADVDANSRLPMGRFAKNVSFSVVAMDHVCHACPALLQESLEPVLRMIAEKALQPAWPLQVYPVSALEDAFRLVQSGKSSGKVVISLGEADIVRTSLRHEPSYLLSPDATYVIAGGLGGLGRSSARWMASMGAKHLILLSRSGPKTDASRQLIEELAKHGVNVRTPRCDVACMDALSAALLDCSDLPPIKGCIQATMVLQDTIFEKLTYAQWDATIRSKVHSTLNLHSLLPTDLDFFILLSSLAGVFGSVSQANYAAGNAFQDAFAAYRRSLGQRAISLDLGRMDGVGIIAENEKYAQNQNNVPVMAHIPEADFHALLEQCCRPEHKDTPDQVVPEPKPGTLAQTHQILVGLTTPAQFRAQNIDPPTWLLERGLFKTLQRELVEDTEGEHFPDPNTASNSPSYWQSAFVRAGPSSASSVVVKGLTQKLSRALDVSIEEIDLQRSLAMQGVDSLLAVELRHWISRAFKADVSALDISSAPSLDELGALIVERSELFQGQRAEMQ
ncbi:polyketide synthase [Aspergillus nomiae NRRL 13137]|uniref:Polyketide synthase n=1 Tax=Aspergillus nomiae NRRL (strain ATCC 15546 / NRRL 13137 / CBS 260.88 / M93) TaxID=1509407 RepID=A0A0L1JB56_ASPN3|nr:polyketide synthase [Aspergillus nomiae NRRL 13137]KNG88668.1 polyketide synthase [Aspergillus nomiae NRRL 13137]